MKRFFDLFVSIITLFFFIVPMIFIAIIIKMTSNGPVIHLSRRIGINNNKFLMPKFRTMHNNTPHVATHLLSDSDMYITKFGRFLRLSSLDELPQLVSVLKGDMSLVGPRPALFNQYDLIDLRKQNSVDSLRPGITGWAQINGRDNISIHEKVKLDPEYMNKRSFFLDIKILWFTIFTITHKNKISH